MQNSSQQLFDGIDSYLFSLVHYAGDRPNNNNQNNIPPPYSNTNYNNIQNRYNDYVRQNIPANQYNCNRYDNRNLNNRNHEQILNNRYYNDELSVTRPQQQNSLYNPYHFMRYPQNKFYARPQLQPPNRPHFQSRPFNRQINTVWRINENIQQIPGNLHHSFDDNNQNYASTNAISSNQNACDVTSRSNQANDINCFEIDTEADYSNLEKNQIETTSSNVPPEKPSSENVSVVHGIISAFSNVTQESAPLIIPPSNVTVNETRKKRSKSNKKNMSKLKSSNITIIPKDVNTVICLDSESEDDDDVIEIPKSPIPMICLEDSDNENKEDYIQNNENNLENEVVSTINITESITNITPSQVQQISPEIGLNLEQNIIAETSNNNVQEITTSPKNDETNSISISKNKKQKTKQISDSVDNIENMVQNEAETPVNVEESGSENISNQEVQIPSTAEPNLDQNITEISNSSIQKTFTPPKEDKTNITPLSKNKKRLKRKREYVDTIENTLQNEIVTPVNIGENGSENIPNQEVQISSTAEPNLDQNITEISNSSIQKTFTPPKEDETNTTPLSKNKKRSKRKREYMDTIENMLQNEAVTPVNIGESGSENIPNQEVQILSTVKPSVNQNITETLNNNIQKTSTPPREDEINTTPVTKNKKRQKRKRENVKNIERNASENIANQELQILSEPNLVKETQTNSTPILKKKKRRRNKGVRKFFIELRNDNLASKTSTENVKENASNPELNTPSEFKNNLEENITEISEENVQKIGVLSEDGRTDSTSILNNTTNQKKKRHRPITRSISKAMEVQAVHLFLSPSGKAKKRQRYKLRKKNLLKLSERSENLPMSGTDQNSIQSNNSISSNISKKNITIPQTLIPDIYETESSCSDIFEKESPEQKNQASTVKRSSFAELDLNQFANMITTSRSIENNKSDTIVCPKSSQNSQITSVSFSSDNWHRVIATNSDKLITFDDTSSSSDESEINEKNTSQNITNDNSSEMHEIRTLPLNSTLNLTKSNDQSNTSRYSLVPLNNDEGNTTVDVNYVQFINQLENKIREVDSSSQSHSETILNSETLCNSTNNESTKQLTKTSSDSDVELITTELNDSVILLDSDQESIITVDDSDLNDVGDICLNVSGGDILSMQNNVNKCNSDNLNISKMEERAMNLKMRFQTYWTPDRESFYNGSWGGENYDHEVEQSLMPGSLKEWANPIDKIRMRKSLDSKIRCRNCRQQGHISKNCPVPIKACSMCGSKQHREFRCNESCCLTCFSKYNRRIFTPNCKRCLNWRNIYCKTCHNKGHIHDYCPDLWRRYHLTIKPGEIIQPSQQAQYRSTIWCSICAQKGHSSDKCRYYYNILYTPPDPMLVKNYVDLYDYNGTSPKCQKFNNNRNDNHWDIHNMKFIEENNRFVKTTTITTSTTITTTAISNELNSTTTATQINTCKILPISKQTNIIDLVSTESISNTLHATKQASPLLDEPVVSVSNTLKSTNTELIITVPDEPINQTAITSSTSEISPSITTETKSNAIETVTTEIVTVGPVPTETIKTESNSLNEINPIDKTNASESVTTELDVPNSTQQASNSHSLTEMPRICLMEEFFDSDVPLTEYEEQRVQEYLMKYLFDEFHANVYIRQGYTVRFLHIRANIAYRNKIYECLRKFFEDMTIPMNVQLKLTGAFEKLLRKIHQDYPLIEKVRKLQDPYTLYQQYTNLLAIKKPWTHHKIALIIKKLNVFRCIHCKKLTNETYKSLDFLRDLFSIDIQNALLRLKLKDEAIHAYKHVFQNIKSTKLDQIINEFNEKNQLQTVPEQQTSRKKQKLTKKQKKLRKFKVLWEKQNLSKIYTTSTNNDIIKYANQLKLSVTNIKQKVILKRCLRNNDLNKKITKKKFQSIMTIGNKLKIPFPECT